jgi:hypothetical protein
MQSLRDRYLARLTPSEREYLGSDEHAERVRRLSPRLPVGLIRRNPGSLSVSGARP